MSAPYRLPVSIQIEEAAGTDETLYVGVPAADGAEWKLIYASFVPSTTTAANATDYVTLAVLNGATSLGSLDTSATAFTAGTTRSMTLSDIAAAEFTAGTDALKVTVTNATTTGAAIHGTLMVVFEKYE
jgi:hypothetical protein